jgi:ankyrin repeat protein
MKSQLIAIVAAVVLVGCGESQKSATSPESKPDEPVAEAVKPEQPTAKAPNISIHDAVEKGNIEAVKQHLAAGKDVNVRRGLLRVTPLHLATEGGHKEVIELLIAKGADVNVKGGRGETPLDFAIKYKRTELADILRKHGGKTGEELKAESN